MYQPSSAKPSGGLICSFQDVLILFSSPYIPKIPRTLETDLQRPYTPPPQACSTPSQHTCRKSATSSACFTFFLSCISSNQSSHWTVNSSRMTCFNSSDSGPVSGLSVVNVWEPQLSPKITQKLPVSCYCQELSLHPLLGQCGPKKDVEILV